jgi:hypothetical protein
VTLLFTRPVSRKSSIQKRESTVAKTQKISFIVEFEVGKDDIQMRQNSYDLVQEVNLWIMKWMKKITSIGCTVQ